MIYDYFKNLSKYDIITADIQNFLERQDLSIGRYNLEDGAFALVSEYQTKEAEKGKFESHRKYIDIQCFLSGEEIIEVTPIYGLEVDIPYDSKADIVFYKNGNESQKIDLKMFSKTFCVLYPEEAHKPGLKISEPTKVKKIVVKVPVKD